MLKNLLTQFGVLYGTRFTNSEKERFKDALIKELTPMNVKVNMVKKGEAHHIFITPQNPTNKVIIVPYDTPARVLSRNIRYVPQSPRQNKKNITKEIMTRLVYAIVGISSSIGIIHLSTVSQTPIIKIGFVTLALGLLIYTISKISVVGSKHNMNHCSASLALALSLVLDTQATCSIVLCDNTYREFKIESLIQELKDTYNADILTLGPLAHGSTMFIAKNQPGIYQHLKSKGYDINRVDNTNGFCLYVGDQNSDIHGIKRPPMNQDYKVDVTRLEAIRNAIIEWKEVT